MTMILCNKNKYIKITKSFLYEKYYFYDFSILDIRSEED